MSTEAVGDFGLIGLAVSCFDASRIYRDRSKSWMSSHVSATSERVARNYPEASSLPTFPKPRQQPERPGIGIC
jgi:hypothetical protein